MKIFPMDEIKGPETYTANPNVVTNKEIKLS